MATFVDSVVLHLRAGAGGNGCASIRREKFKPLAGPDGGNGGNGGDIVLVATHNESSLLAYHRSPHRRSENGGFGMGNFRNGTSGAELELPVPAGTVVTSDTGDILADLVEPGMRFVVAQGGQGGLGNAALASPKRKAPGFALLGTPGWEGEVRLELKLLADVAFVGYPSAGKSSLIAAMSAAKPKIADYPFTTLTPNLGVVQYGQFRYTVADVPGLIEGASKGRGLGLEFLRHVERCSALLHVLDCATLEPHRDPISDLDVILKELEAYPVPEGQTPLTRRPQLVALGKIDVPEAAELAALVRPELQARGFRVFEISTVTHQGLRELGLALGDLVNETRQLAESTRIPRIVVRPLASREPDFTIRVEGGTEPIYRVLGVKPERWVAQTDFTNDEAVGYLADRFAKLGLEEALFAHGALAGSTVVIGDDGVVFDWEPTIGSTAELMTTPRGTDARFDTNLRPTRRQRRETYHERMDAKAEVRAELDTERLAGIWQDDKKPHLDSAEPQPTDEKHPDSAHMSAPTRKPSRSTPQTHSRRTPE